ncbi:translation protein [Dipodascopsis uninucleata]
MYKSWSTNLSTRSLLKAASFQQSSLSATQSTVFIGRIEVNNALNYMVNIKQQKAWVQTQISSTVPIASVEEGFKRLKRSELPLPELLDSPTMAHSRKQLPYRTGTLAIKQGMMAYFEPDGKRIPVTVLHVDRAQVTAVKTDKKEGYFAVQIGIGSRNPRNIKKPMLGHFAKADVPPKRFVKEFRVRDARGLIPVGMPITCEHFIEGQFIDIRGVSKGKGYAGVMKRHGFSGLPASHGVTKAHRSAGAVGQHQDPGRILPGKKMAGHMGVTNVTVQNAKVVKVYPEYDIILVKGPVPGPNGTAVKIHDSIKKECPVPLESLTGLGSL